MRYFTFLSFLFVLIISCSKDPCEDLSCGDFGTCNDGTCVCEQYYEGTNCESEIRSRYIGSWIGDISCDDGTNSTNIRFEITPAVEVQKIRIQSSQIYSNTQFVGELQEDNSIDIPRFQGGGLNFFFGDIEELGTDRILMEITLESTNSACSFALMRE